MTKWETTEAVACNAADVDFHRVRRGSRERSEVNESSSGEGYSRLAEAFNT